MGTPCFCRPPFVEVAGCGDAMNWEEVEQHCCLVKPGGWVERSETGIEDRKIIPPDSRTHGRSVATSPGIFGHLSQHPKLN